MIWFQKINITLKKWIPREVDDLAQRPYHPWIIRLAIMELRTSNDEKSERIINEASVYCLLVAFELRQEDKF